MKKTLIYTDETKESLIAEQKALGFELVEDQCHFDGKFLVFSDGKPPRDLEAEIDALKARIEKLEKR